MKLRILLALIGLNLLACMSVTVQLNPRFPPLLKPSYEDYMNGYVFGLFGQGEFSLTKVCMDQKPYGFQRIKTFDDWFITTFTLGIYSPTTIRIWCGD